MWELYMLHCHTLVICAYYGTHFQKNVSKIFHLAHTQGFSVLHIYKMIQGSGGKFGKHFFKMGPPSAYTWQIQCMNGLTIGTSVIEISSS